jgi:Enoyl-CoA hydratase/isomerase/Succinyl-CoA ligase like flavodoxin domain/Ligase-CoA domain
LQLKASSLSCPQSPQRRRRNPCARMPHSRKASNSSRTNCGSLALAASSDCFVFTRREKPWIAAIAGLALAGGCEIALACEMRVCGESAQPGLPELKRGIVAAAGGPLRLARCTPLAIAIEMVATAAMSHTGSLAGADAAWGALFERTGVVPVRRLEDLVETRCFFAKAGRPKGTGVAVASSSGGCGVMAADMAEAHGVALPSPGPAAHDVLRSHVPEYGSITNPVDFTGAVAGATGGPAACANALRADPQYSSLIVTTVTGDATSAKRQEQYYEPSRRHGKIICLYWVSSWADGTGVR